MKGNESYSSQIHTIPIDELIVCNLTIFDFCSAVLGSLTIKFSGEYFFSCRFKQLNPTNILSKCWFLVTGESIITCIICIYVYIYICTLQFKKCNWDIYLKCMETYLRLTGGLRRLKSSRGRLLQDGGGPRLLERFSPVDNSTRTRQPHIVLKRTLRNWSSLKKIHALRSLKMGFLCYLPSSSLTASDASLGSSNSTKAKPGGFLATQTLLKGP